MQAGAAGRIGSGDGQCHGRHAVTRITRKGSEGASAWIPRPHKAVIEDEWNHRPHGYSREAGMLWVQQIVMFEGNNCGANLKNRRSTRVDPSVAELLLTGATEPGYQIFFRQHPDVLGHDRLNYDITGWKILTCHVHQILQHG